HGSQAHGINEQNIRRFDDIGRQRDLAQLHGRRWLIRKSRWWYTGSSDSLLHLYRRRQLLARGLGRWLTLVRPLLRRRVSRLRNARLVRRELSRRRPIRARLIGPGAVDDRFVLSIMSRARGSPRNRAPGLCARPMPLYAKEKAGEYPERLKKARADFQKEGS